MKFIVLGAPVGKGRPRATTIGGHVSLYTDKKTTTYEKYVRECYMSQLGTPIPSDKYAKLTIKVFWPIPKTTPKKTKQLMLDHVIFPDKKPDVDNISKIIMDALNGFVYNDDKQVIELSISKEYSEEPLVEVNYEFMD